MYRQIVLSMQKMEAEFKQTYEEFADCAANGNRVDLGDFLSSWPHVEDLPSLEDMRQWTVETARAEVMATFMPGMEDLEGIAEQFAAVSKKLCICQRRALRSSAETSSQERLKDLFEVENVYTEMFEVLHQYGVGSLAKRFCASEVDSALCGIEDKKERREHTKRSIEQSFADMNWTIDLFSRRVEACKEAWGGVLGHFKVDDPEGA